MLFGIGLPIIPYGDSKLPTDTIDGNCPNDDCVRSSIEYSGTELGLYAKIGLKLFLDNLYLNVIGGGTVVTESEIVKSPTTDRYYEASTDSVLNPMYGVGLGYFPDIYDWQLVIQIDVDNRRGVSGLVGWYWYDALQGELDYQSKLALAPSGTLHPVPFCKQNPQHNYPVP